jgi:hypothetical protein
MWNLAQFSNPLFFSRSNASRDTPRMLTRETVGVRWRPFAFWFYKKGEIGKICLNGESDSCFGCCIRVQQLQWQWSIRLEMYPVWLILGSISTLSLHIYLFVKTRWNEKSCWLDDNFDLRTNYLFGQATTSVSVGEERKWIMLIFTSWK